MNIYRVADKDIIFNDNSHKSYENLIKRAQRPFPVSIATFQGLNVPNVPFPVSIATFQGLNVPNVPFLVSIATLQQKKHPRLVTGTLSFVLRKSLVCGRTFT